MSPPEEIAVFPDTNVFLHYRPLSELDWCSMAQARSVRVQIAPVVMRELEERKVLHPIKRIRERADRALQMLFRFSQAGAPCQMREGVLLDFLIHEPSQEFAIAKHLNLQLADDWLIATVLAFREAQPDTKILFVTNDLSLIVKARHYQIDTLQPPSEQRLPDEPDPGEQKMRALEEELQQYKSRVPDLSMVFDDGEQHKKFQIFAPLPNVESEIAAQLKAIKEKHPLSKTEPKPQQTGVDRSGILAQQVAEAIKRIADMQMSFQGDYDSKLKEWYRRYGDYLRETAAFKDRARRTIVLELVLVNRGTCPADDIDLMFQFPDGFDIHDEKNRPKPPKEPALPSPEYASPLLHIPVSLRPQMPQLPQLRNLNAPKIRKTNSYEVTFHCDRLKHDFRYHCEPLYLTFDSFDAAQSFSFNYHINAANAPLPQNGVLHVILENQT